LTRRSDYRDLPRDQIRSQQRQPLSMIVSPPIFDCDILAFDEASIAQTSRNALKRPESRSREAPLR